MSSKKYKGKTCAYCGVPGASSTGDHVIARRFLLNRHRGNLPTVPSCTSCNGSKSKLETYLLQVLPLGANHADAAETNVVLMSKRAQNKANAVLQTILREPAREVLLYDQDGNAHERTITYVDADALREWCGLVARGLAFFHWGVVTPEHDVQTIPLTSESEVTILKIAQRLRDNGFAEGCLGNGAFSYRGFREHGYLNGSVWFLDLYGRMPIGGDASVSDALAATWAVFISRKESVTPTAA